MMINDQWWLDGLCLMMFIVKWFMLNDGLSVSTRWDASNDFNDMLELVEANTLAGLEDDLQEDGQRWQTLGSRWEDAVGWASLGFAWEMTWVLVGYPSCLAGQWVWSKSPGVNHPWDQPLVASCHELVPLLAAGWLLAGVVQKGLSLLRLVVWVSKLMGWSDNDQSSRHSFSNTSNRMI